MPPRFVPLTAVEAVLEPVAWTFAQERAAEIAAHWQRLTADNPRLFKGTILLQHRWSLEGGVYRCAYHPATYDAFIAWRDFGWPGVPRRNGFAMAMLRASDGAFLLGRMSAHTSNAGRVYFPAGTPDLDDVMPDGRIDLAGSLLRELREETGLDPSEVTIGDGWLAAIETHHVAFLRDVRVVWPAAEAKAIIERRLATLADDELSGIVTVAHPGEIDEATMPSFVVAALRAAFCGEAQPG